MWLWLSTNKPRDPEDLAAVWWCVIKAQRPQPPNHLFWKVNHQMLAGVKWKQPNMKTEHFPHATQAIRSRKKCKTDACYWLYKPHVFLNVSFLAQVYRSFGLGSSYAKVMKFGCLLQYSDYVVANIDFPDFPHRLLEDIYQVRMHKSVKTFDEALVMTHWRNPRNLPKDGFTCMSISRPSSIPWILAKWKSKLNPWSPVRLIFFILYA